MITAPMRHFSARLLVSALAASLFSARVALAQESPQDSPQLISLPAEGVSVPSSHREVQGEVMAGNARLAKMRDHLRKRKEARKAASCATCTGTGTGAVELTSDAVFTGEATTAGSTEALAAEGGSESFIHYPQQYLYQPRPPIIIKGDCGCNGNGNGNGDDNGNGYRYYTCKCKRGRRRCNDDDSDSDSDDENGGGPGSGPNGDCDCEDLEERIEDLED